MRTCVECDVEQPISCFKVYGRRLPVCRKCRCPLEWGIGASHFIRRLKVYLWMTRKDPIYYRKRG